MFRGTPCIYPRCVDLRTGAFDVPPQEILTKDSVTVSVDAVVYYQVQGVKLLFTTRYRVSSCSFLPGTGFPAVVYYQVEGVQL